MRESKLNLLKPQKAPATVVTAQCMKWKDMPFASCRHYSSNLTESHYKRGGRKKSYGTIRTKLVLISFFFFFVVADPFQSLAKVLKKKFMI